MLNLTFPFFTLARHPKSCDGWIQPGCESRIKNLTMDFCNWNCASDCCFHWADRCGIMAQCLNTSMSHNSFINFNTDWKLFSGTRRIILQAEPQSWTIVILPYLVPFTLYVFFTTGFSSQIITLHQNRGYSVSSVCLFQSLSVCACLSVCKSVISVNKILAQRMHRF